DDVRVETALHGLGDALEIRGDFQESRAALTRALDIARRVGEDPATIARIEGDLGNTDDDAGDPAAALVHYQSAEEVLKKTGAGPLLIARLEINIAYAEEHRGRRPEALVHAKNALAAFEAGESPDSANLVDVLLLIGALSRGVGQLDDSARYLRRGIAIVDRDVGADNARGVDLREQLGRTLIELHRPREALDVLGPAMVAVERGRDVNPGVAAETRMVLADALWDSGGDRARARAEATRARDAYLTLGGRGGVADSLRLAEVWLRTHP